MLAKDASLHRIRDKSKQNKASNTTQGLIWDGVKGRTVEQIMTLVSGRREEWVTLQKYVERLRTERYIERASQGYTKQLIHYANSL